MKSIHWLGAMVALLALAGGCTSGPAVKETADAIFYNAVVHTVDPQQPKAWGIAVKAGRIIAVGDSSAVFALKGENTRLHNLQGAFVMPGFIDGHAHFSGLGASLQNLNFLKSRSWDEIVAQVAAKAAGTPKGQWITGRGWHQEKWDSAPGGISIDGYPSHHTLSAVSAEHPVLLRHASGHSLFANARAMELAGVSAETPDPAGGRILRDSKGNPIGVFEERAMALINDVYDAYLAGLSDEALKQEWLAGIALAEEECLRKGITSFQDAGSSFDEIAWYKDLAEKGELDLRLWAMVRRSYGEMNEGLSKGFPILNAGDRFFTCRAIKSELDGALGAFGAWLLKPYSDNPDFSGQNTTLVSTVDSIAELAMRHNMQLCVHAIGDRANRVFLDIVARLSERRPEIKNMRWRSEHAQHLDPADIPRFAQLGVIASMQGVHCTSDAPFVVKRLGDDRAQKGAYAWRSLLDAGAVVTNGTDAPVEDVDPLLSFYATVTRRRPDTGLIFYPEQALTREEAIYSYTYAPAYAAFEETDKGSLIVGKLADMVVLSNNLLTCNDDDILKTQVLMTVVGGAVKYQRK